jgi:hypothetical protein
MFSYHRYSSESSESSASPSSKTSSSNSRPSSSSAYNHSCLPTRPLQRPLHSPNLNPTFPLPHTVLLYTSLINTLVLRKRYDPACPSGSSSIFLGKRRQEGKGKTGKVDMVPLSGDQRALCLRPARNPFIPGPRNALPLLAPSPLSAS